jgi:hypothetical protein
LTTTATIPSDDDGDGDGDDFFLCLRSRDGKISMRDEADPF